MTGTPKELPSLEELYDRASGGLLLADPDGLIRRVNRTFCDWLGYGATELVGKKKFPKLLTMGGQIFLQTHFIPLLQIQRSVAEVKLDFVHADGSVVPMLINCARRHHAAEEFDQLFAFLAHDRQKYERELLAARRKAEELSEKLASANQKKDEFLAMLAHELRNPLAPMRNVLEILKKKKDIVDPQIIWSRDVLDRQLGFMNHLVDDLLEASRITQGKIDLRLAQVNLTELLRNAAEAARPTIERANHVLTVQFPKQPVIFVADSTRLIQVVVNLLNNAAKFTPSGGSIALAGGCEGREVVITVTDSGVGIAPEKLDEIFEMFSQLASTRHTSQGGLGIGLALVRALVALHHGTVRADSDGPGTGSVFTIRLPILELEPIELVENSSNPARRQPALRIIVVDDNADSAATMSMLLQLNGHEVVTAPDGSSALEKSREFRPHVVLLDIGLPDMTGYEVARRVRLEDWGIQTLLIATTGWGQDTDKGRAVDAGFDHHLTKPVNFQELESALAAYSNRRQLH